MNVFFEDKNDLIDSKNEFILNQIKRNYFIFLFIYIDNKILNLQYLSYGMTHTARAKKNSLLN